MSFWDELETESDDFWDEEYDPSLDLAMEDVEENYSEDSSEDYTPEDYQGGNSFTDDIVRKESGGNYKATNPHSSAAGKYQFLWGTWGKDIENFTGIKSKQEFLNSPKAQDSFYHNYYIPKKLIPAVSRIRKQTNTSLSNEQLAKLYHFRGEQGAIDYLEGKISDKPEAYNSSISDYIKQYGGTSYNPQYYNSDGTIKKSSWLGDNIKLENLSDYQDVSPTSNNNELYNFGFVENFADIYGDVSSWIKNKGSKLAQGASTILDTTNDYLSDIETTKKYRKLSEYLNKGRYFPINQTVNNIPIFT